MHQFRSHLCHSSSHCGKGQLFIQACHMLAYSATDICDKARLAGITAQYSPPWRLVTCAACHCTVSVWTINQLELWFFYNWEHPYTVFISADLAPHLASSYHSLNSKTTSGQLLCYQALNNVIWCSLNFISYLYWIQCFPTVLLKYSSYMNVHELGNQKLIV